MLISLFFLPKSVATMDKGCVVEGLAAATTMATITWCSKRRYFSFCTFSMEVQVLGWRVCFLTILSFAYCRVCVFKHLPSSDLLWYEIFGFTFFVKGKRVYVVFFPVEGSDTWWSKWIDNSVFWPVWFHPFWFIWLCFHSFYIPLLRTWPRYSTKNGKVQQNEEPAINGYQALFGYRDHRNMPPC